MSLKTFPQIILLINAMHIIYAQTGPYGQDCTPAQGDFPDKCKDIGGTYEQRGKVECFNNFDCCTCGRIICNQCDIFNGNGDSSIFGVKDIVVNGKKNTGSTVDCNGDLSCKETAIVGTNINSLKFSGDGAAAYSEVDVACISCPVYCLGDNSCEYATMSIEKSNGILFAARAGQYGTFKLLSNLGGALGCTSYDACKSAIISINNIERIMCDGENSCQDAVMNVFNPQNKIFAVECKSVNACNNMRLNIEVDDENINDLGGIWCNGPSSCDGLTITVYKKIGQEKLEINALICNAPNACDNISFTMTNTRFRGCAGCSTELRKLITDKTKRYINVAI